MSEIVNLRRARKQRSREEKEAKASANLAKFGVSRKERKLAETKRFRGEKLLDSHKRDN